MIIKSFLSKWSLIISFLFNLSLLVLFFYYIFLPLYLDSTSSSFFLTIIFWNHRVYFFHHLKIILIPFSHFDFNFIFLFLLFAFFDLFLFNNNNLIRFCCLVNIKENLKIHVRVPKIFCQILKLKSKWMVVAEELACWIK